MVCLQLGGFLVLSLLDLGQLGRGFVSKRRTSPVLLNLVSTLVEVGLHGLDDLVQSGTVGRLDLKRCKNVMKLISRIYLIARRSAFI